MARTLDDVIQGLPFDQQREVEALAVCLIDDEMMRRDVRKASVLNQERIAVLSGDIIPISFGHQ